MGPYLRIFRDYGIAIAAAVSIALFFRVFVVESYRIPTEVMRPTLEPGDVIFVTKWHYGGIRSVFLSEEDLPLPDYGDVVIYSPPDDPRKSYIRRVIALPGDRIEVVNGRVILNGKPIPFTASQNVACGTETHPAGSYEVCIEPPLIDDYEEKTVPPGSVFVLSDLRTQKPGQKRGMGLMPASKITGTARWIWLSLGDSGQIRFERVFSRIR